MRLELRRQAADRELGAAAHARRDGARRLGGVGGDVRRADLEAASVASRAVLAAGWLLLLGALASAFTAQRQVGARRRPPARAFRRPARPALRHSGC